MRRWRTALIGAAALAALLVPVQTAAGDPRTQPRGASLGPAYQLGHSKIKASAARNADHTITLRGIDVNGQPVAPLASLIDVESGAEIPLTETADSLTGVAPAGEYSLTGILLTGTRDAPTDLALYGNPALAVNGDVDLTLDARTATEITAASPSTTATKIHSHAMIVQTIAGQPISTIVSGRPGLPVRAWPSVTSTTRPYHFVYAESQTEPLDTLPTPRVYKLVFPTAGRVPADLAFTAAPGSLALANTTYAAQGVPSSAAGIHSEVFDVVAADGASPDLVHFADAPSTQRVYYTADGVRWIGNYSYRVGTVQLPERHTKLRGFTAGATYDETWNKAAFGPTVKVGHGQGQFIAFPLLTDTGQPGHEGLSGNVSGTPGTLTLYRNGVKVGESTNPLAGDWTVPAAAATFRLDLAVNRAFAFSAYAKKINARWTFPSAERPGDPYDNQRRLLQPRITGAFDSNGRAPSGTTFPLDVVVERAVDGTAVSSSSLEVSFNDGATWTRVTLAPNGTDRWTANVTHPTSHNGFVALRYKAADSSGNTVQQTVTRAYGLR